MNTEPMVRIKKRDAYIETSLTNAFHYMRDKITQDDKIKIKYEGRSNTIIITIL